MSEIEITTPAPAPEAVPSAYVDPTPVSAPLAPTPELEKPAIPTPAPTLQRAQAGPTNPPDPPQYPRIAGPQTGVTIDFPVPASIPTGDASLQSPEQTVEPVCYTDHARANREEAIAHLERLLADMPPVHSIPREYAETRSDLVFAIHNLKAGRK